MKDTLRVVIADDERPARSLLAAMLRSFDDVTIVGEAKNGAEAVEIIEQTRPDLALLDLQMPELDGLSVVRLLQKKFTPLVAFVTAYDEYAVRAFELNAVDYLLKPVDAARLRQTLTRAIERLEHESAVETASENVRKAAQLYESSVPQGYLERIPVRRRDEIVIVPVVHIASVIAEGELLHLTTLKGERFTLSHRLKDLEGRLDPARFLRLGRGMLAQVDCITRVNPLPGGTYLVCLSNGQQLKASRIQSRILREQFLKL